MKRLSILALLVLAPFAVTPAAGAASTGKIQGKIVATDTGEPIGYASVSLIPADTTQKPIGRMTNADGTFLIEAPAGRYRLTFLALSYGKKTIEGVVLEPGKVLPFDTALAPEAIQQEEIVVEAKARENSEVSMLAARKKATSVGDAVSAEQVRKSPDKNAAEVLRRVTGLSVSDGKYVFVRGLGERYSSTEVDGVRITSPEQNKRVVPLDLFPASLLENVVVQKTYTADRPGEFGGGDVQIHTKDFPGGRTFAVAASFGAVTGVTFKDRRTYPGGKGDWFGFGADHRGMPAEVNTLGGGQKLNEGVVPFPTLVEIGKSFRPVYSPRDETTAPNAYYQATYGDEYKLFGHPLGFITSWSLNRTFDNHDETQRLFRSASADTIYDYDVNRSTMSVQMGGVGGLSYRFSPQHTLHLRGLYTNSADDEVRVYEGADHTRTDASGLPLVHRGTRLQYIQRSILSGTLEGKHELPSLGQMSVDWKVTRSHADRQQPDRRETVYDQRSYYDFGTGQTITQWVIGSQGDRQFGDLNDNGWGGVGSASMPFQLGGLGKGRVKVGVDHQSKDRENLYRRFEIIHSPMDSLLTLPPDSLFATSTFDSSKSNSAYVIETTFNDAHFTDNYNAHQRVNAGYVSVDVPMGMRWRGNLGVRIEDAFQNVKSVDPFNGDSTVQEGKLENTDWLPSANVVWGPNERMNVRLAASRTVSRPDLNELSPSPSIDYEGGSMVLGNPNLKRAQIDNYDVRFEMFPSLSEVLAVGFFYKNLHQPIELVIQGAADPLVYPQNSDRGHNLGWELEARSGLGRLWKKLERFSVNTNATIIHSKVYLDLTSSNGSNEHPLQGQAAYLVNGALSYSSPTHATETTALVSIVGKRLVELGYAPLPDIYEQAFTSLDWTMSFNALRRARVKLAAKNLLDPHIRRVQGPHEVSQFQYGRTFSVGISYGL